MCFRPIDNCSTYYRTFDRYFLKFFTLRKSLRILILQSILGVGLQHVHISESCWFYIGLLQWRSARKFRGAEISRVGVWVVGGRFSPSGISRLRRPKNIKFGIKVASSTRIMHALIFLGKFLIAAKLQKNAKKTKMPKKSTFFSTRYLCLNGNNWRWIKE